MSHLSVLVIADQKPTNDVLTRLLQPYHEFECTGRDDQYVVDIDITEEVRADFVKSKTDKLRDPDGGLHCPYDNRFFRDPTPEEQAVINAASPIDRYSGKIDGNRYTSEDWRDGLGYRPKFHFIPEGWEEVEVLRSDVQTFAEYVSEYHGYKTVAYGESPYIGDTHKHGYSLLDEKGDVAKVVKRTNPQARWDWWVLGGRYRGRLHLLGNAKGEKAERSRWDEDQSIPEGYDTARRGDLDLARMKAERTKERVEWVEDGMRQSGLTWDEIDTGLQDLEKARAVFEALHDGKPPWREYGDWLQANATPLALKARAGFFERPEPKEGQSLREWTEDVVPLTTWAVLKDGEWTEKGSMGWFGMASNETDEGEWHRSVWQMIEDLGPDQYIAVVDCHI
jgi:hypothetical protein